MPAHTPVTLQQCFLTGDKWMLDCRDHQSVEQSLSIADKMLLPVEIVSISGKSYPNQIIPSLHSADPPMSGKRLKIAHNTELPHQIGVAADTSDLNA